MLVTRIIGACPSCMVQDAFGNVMVVRDHVVRGCKVCAYSERVPLPPVSKRTIYLDQFFFSGAFREKDERFVAAANKIREASAAQLLVAPYSSVHEDETQQWRGFDGRTRDELMEFIKATSRGHELEPSYRIEHDQILEAFRAYREGRPSVLELDRRSAFRSDFDQWEGYFRISVGAYHGDSELLRSLKAKGVEELVTNVFPAWRKSTASFEEHVELELNDAAKHYIKFYIDYVARILKGDYNALFDSPIASMIVQDMIDILPSELPIEEKVAIVKTFFSSDHFANVPHEWVSARIFAVLRSQVKSGAYPNADQAARRLSGFFQDVGHVSMYGPYVDSIVVDQPMATILSDGRLSFTRRFGTAVFSLNNWDDLGRWIDFLLASMTQDHRRALAIAYP